MKILVTGAAGFIGFHISIALIERGDQVVGVDNLNNYYDPNLKQLRLDKILKHSNSKNFEFIKADISNRKIIEKLFNQHKFDVVVNLAAQAGVRYSLKDPHAYVDSNLVGFVNILQGCRQSKVKHLVYGSSSSVYGMNVKQPFSIGDRVDHPISLYAATKKSNELMAYSYSHLYGIPSTGLRFFSVYGPYGRPDMAYYKFTKAILNEETIDIYNNGEMKRDFTYIDDIVKGVISVIDSTPSPQKNPETSIEAPYKLYNIGNNNAVSLLDFIASIEKSCNKKAKKNYLSMQPGDVKSTFADIDDLENDFGFRPSTSIDTGIKKFVNWYLNLGKNK